MFYCKKPNLKGDCYTAHISTGECVGVVSDYVNQVASFLPSGTKCTIYRQVWTYSMDALEANAKQTDSGGGCSGSSTSVGPAGAFQLDGHVSSYKCQSYRDAWGW